MKLVQGMYENVRSCIQVGEGLSDQFEVKAVYTRALCSVCCSLSLCLRLCHRSFELKYLGRTFMPMTLSLLQTPWKNVSIDCCDMEGGYGEKGAESEFPTRSHTNWAVQPQKIARGLKFCI